MSQQVLKRCTSIKDLRGEVIGRNFKIDPIRFFNSANIIYRYMLNSDTFTVSNADHDLF